MERIKYTKVVNCPVREEMFIQIHKICQDKDIPLSVFIREALKVKLNAELKNG